jgi:hypothetical protein
MLQSNQEEIKVCQSISIRHTDQGEKLHFKDIFESEVL